MSQFGTVRVYALFHKRAGKQVSPKGGEYDNWTREKGEPCPRERALRIWEVKLKDKRYVLRSVGRVPYQGVQLV